ncbi:hypothetical protein EV1_043955 [Malus domestica]
MALSHLFESDWATVLLQTQLKSCLRQVDRKRCNLRHHLQEVGWDSVGGHRDHYGLGQPLGSTVTILARGLRLHSRFTPAGSFHK